MFLQVNETYQDAAGKPCSRNNLINMDEIATIVASDDGKTLFYMANQRVVDETNHTGIVQTNLKFEVFEKDITKYAEIGKDAYLKVFQRSVDTHGQPIMRPSYINVHYISNILPNENGEAIIVMCNYQVIKFEGKTGAIGLLETNKPYDDFVSEFNNALGKYIGFIL